MKYPVELEWTLEGEKGLVSGGKEGLDGKVGKKRILRRIERGRPGSPAVIKPKGQGFKKLRVETREGGRAKEKSYPDTGWKRILSRARGV